MNLSNLSRSDVLEFCRSRMERIESVKILFGLKSLKLKQEISDSNDRWERI